MQEYVVDEVYNFAQQAKIWWFVYICVYLTVFVYQALMLLVYVLCISLCLSLCHCIYHCSITSKDLPVCVYQALVPWVPAGCAGLVG